MLPEIKYLPVNWVDGMKITKDHFIQNQIAHLDQLRDLSGIFLNDFNYGILPPVPGEKKPLDIKIFLDNNDLLKIKVMACRAITRGGGRIEITPNHHPEFDSEESSLTATYLLDHQDKALLDVIITINPYHRVATGQPDPEESPLRLPYTMPALKLEIIPTEKVTLTDLGAFHLTIGQIRIMGSEVKLSDHYIPPCTSVKCYPPLLDTYYQFGNLLGQLGSDAIKIVQKIKLKSQPAQLTENLQFVGDKMAFYLADHMEEYRTLIPEQAPLHMIMFVGRLARVMKTALACISNTGKEELLKYFQEWTEQRPGIFDNLLDTQIELEYSHVRIGEALNTSSKFLELISHLFSKLSQLDHIGKLKEVAPPRVEPEPEPIKKEIPKPKPGIFIDEEDEPRHNQRKRGLWNF